MDMQKVYIENRQMVFNHVMSIIKNYHDSEEVCNDVFLKMIRLNANPKTAFNPELSALRTWIRTITNSVVLDYFRTNHQDRYKAVSEFVNEEGQETFSFESPKSTQADTDVLSSETKADINSAIESLDVKYRRIAILYFLWQYEYNEIADILNVPMGTVKGMLNRCRAKLQLSLKGSHVIGKQAENA